jgi:hypothetical protein
VLGGIERLGIALLREHQIDARDGDTPTLSDSQHPLPRREDRS